MDGRRVCGRCGRTPTVDGTSAAAAAPAEGAGSWLPRPSGRRWRSGKERTLLRSLDEPAAGPVAAVLGKGGSPHHFGSSPVSHFGDETDKSHHREPPGQASARPRPPSGCTTGVSSPAHVARRGRRAGCSLRKGCPAWHGPRPGRPPAERAARLRTEPRGRGGCPGTRTPGRPDAPDGEETSVGASGDRTGRLVSGPPGPSPSCARRRCPPRSTGPASGPTPARAR